MTFVLPDDDRNISTGFGLLGFTWRSGRVPDERAFPVMKAAIANGATLWSSSSMYGLPPDPATAGIQLLRRYFERYPEDASKVTLFLRCCYDTTAMKPAVDRDSVRASWQEVTDILGPYKKIDVFGPARMDKTVPVETTISALKELMDEGKIGAIGLSEVRAETLRKAAKVAPIRYCEIEFSMWTTDMLENEVALAAKENNVTLWTYAPLGYGFLTGQFKTLDTIPQDDTRRYFGRFQQETFDKNLELVDKVKAIAAKKGVTSAQLALAWIRSHSNEGVCGTLIPIPGATGYERVVENCKVTELTAQERKELDDIIRSTPVVGHRQIPGYEDNINT